MPDVQTGTADYPPRRQHRRNERSYTMGERMYSGDIEPIPPDPKPDPKPKD